MPPNAPPNEGNGLSVAEPLAALSASPAHYTPHDLLKSPVTGNGKEMLT
jgi:hypothetical protein